MSDEEVEAARHAVHHGGGPWLTRGLARDALEAAAAVRVPVPGESAPTPQDLVRELHEAVYGSSWARPESPQVVWDELLRRVRELALVPGESEARESGVGRRDKALRALEDDSHQFSTRPCSTCSTVTRLIGRQFGCVALASRPSVREARKSLATGNPNRRADHSTATVDLGEAQEGT